MLYLTGQQNNRLTFPAFPKKVDFQLQPDLQADLSFENSNDESDSKPDHSVSSTIDSRFNSHKDSFSQDLEYQKEVEEEQLCQEFHQRGYCFKGNNCCFSHTNKSFLDIKRQRKGIFYTQMLQNFPEMIGQTFIERIPSFLQ